MPERLNFSILLETPNDSTIREALISCIRETFYQWIGEVTEISTLDYRNPESEMLNLDMASALKYPVGAYEILSIYFAGLRSERETVLNISKHVPNVVVYTVALPEIGLIAAPLKMSCLMLNLLSRARALGLYCAVAAGSELEIQSSIQSIADLIEAASNAFSSIEYLCLSRINSAGLASFTSVIDKDNALVYRRSHTLNA